MLVMWKIEGICGMPSKIVALKEELHKFIDSSHIYGTKIETWLKFLGLGISFFGGLYAAQVEYDAPYSVAFFIYSVALFMEYFSKLLNATKFSLKMYPLLIVVCGAFIFFDAVTQWNNKGVGFLGGDILMWISSMPVLILFIDTLSITMIEKYKQPSGKQEDNLF